MQMIRMTIYFFVFLLFFYSSTLLAATFTVTTSSDTDCSDFDCRLQNALDTAAVNSEDDTINIGVGTFTPPAAYTYTSSQDKRLSIIGQSADLTVLNGNTARQVLNIQTDLTLPNAHIIIKNLTIAQGYHASDGGGLYIRTGSSNIVIDNCTFQSNATDSFNGGGGANIRGSGIIEIKDSTFTGNAGNSSNSRGGGLYLHGSVSSSVRVIGNIFINNHMASGSSGSGAYIRSVGGSSLQVVKNIFQENSISETDTGGALRLQINSSTFNTTLVNNVFMGNGAPKAAGADWAVSAALIESELGPVTLCNNTISQNQGAEAAAVRIDTDGVDIYNNILWGNAGPYDLVATDTSSPVNLIANIVQMYQVPFGTTTMGNSNSDPMLDPLDYHLLYKNSGAVDNGAATAPALPVTDIDGDSRTLDGDSDGIAIVDRGADEYIPGDQPDCSADGTCNPDCPTSHDLDCNPGSWYEAHMIPNPETGDESTAFGVAVALDNNILAVGATKQNRGSEIDAGAVFLFRRTADKENPWMHWTTVDAGTMIQRDSSFGHEIALEGDWLVVGAPYEEPPVGYSVVDSGAVHIFHRHEGGWNSWGLVQKLYPGVFKNNGYFGNAISLSGNLLVIGHERDPGVEGTASDTPGAVYTYMLDNDTNRWELVNKVGPPDHFPGAPGSLSNAHFGSDVSLIRDLYNNFLVVSAPAANAIFTFIYLEIPARWENIDTLNVSQSVKGYEIIADEKNLAVVEQNSYSYPYNRAKWHEFTGMSWTSGYILEPLSPLQNSDVYRFALSENYLVTGSIVTVSVYYRHTAGLECNQQLQSSDYRAEDYFGSSFTLDGGILAVGASSWNEYQGKVYIFQLPGVELPEPGPVPGGKSPTETYLATINTGETNSHVLDLSAETDLYGILSFGSEFNLKVYKPDGNLFLEKQSEASPITFSVPQAATGKWKMEVNAIEASRPDDPYSLVITAPDGDADGVVDIHDNCPWDANQDQADKDKDGKGDKCDAMCFSFRNRHGKTVTICL